MMKSNGFTPDKINAGKLKYAFGNAIKAEYLIAHQRRTIGDPDQLRGLTPPQLERRKIVEPDFRLIHPQSVEARLQQYIVVSYPDQAELSSAKGTLLKNSDTISVLETDDQADFSALANDDFSIDFEQYQYGLFAINVQSPGQSPGQSAWDLTVGHSYVGIPDSGLDIIYEVDTNGKVVLDTHGHAVIKSRNPDFINNFREHFSYDIVDGDSYVSSALSGGAGHGQHVAGIIAADTNNGLGVAGVCQQCSVIFNRALHDEHKMSAYTYLADVGAQVINSSFPLFKSHLDSKPLPDCNNDPTSQWTSGCEALTLLATRDIVHVAAGGNGDNEDEGPDEYTIGEHEPVTLGSKGRSDRIQFPASDERVIAVGAVNIDGNRTYFSDYGPQLDVVAPAYKVLSTFDRGRDWNIPTPGNSMGGWHCGDSQGLENETGYGTCTGTSMSAPHVTGIVALMRSVDPLLNRVAIQEILEASSSQYPNKDQKLGYGIPDAKLALEKMLGRVNGQVLKNRLTPLFSFYSAAAQDSFYTTVPQMATAAINGTMLPQPPTSVAYLPTYGISTPHYNAFPGFLFPTETPEAVNLPSPTPLAEVYIFTTENNPLNANQPLVPLYRLSYQGANGVNTLNLDHTYTTDNGGLFTFKQAGYLLDGIEGYIFSNAYPQPAGTIKLLRRYNPARDDHAIFPESQRNFMIANGYSGTSGREDIGFVYPNQDIDHDFLIDGFENLIGTCANNADSNGNGVSDATEVLGYPRTDPVQGICNAGTAPLYPWQSNATGILYTNAAWNYAVGYHFTPLVNGQIDQLGGYFNGTKLVKLFNKTTGQLLAQATVTAANTWAYSNITPVAVQANQTYTVAVYVAGSGGSFRTSTVPFMPLTVANNFRIESTTFISTATDSNARPTNNGGAKNMNGQADVRFVPN